MASRIMKILYLKYLIVVSLSENWKLPTVLALNNNLEAAELFNNIIIMKKRKIKIVQNLISPSIQPVSASLRLHYISIYLLLISM